jgi:hypothetical protein
VSSGWQIVIAALGASALTVFGTFWLDIRRDRRKASAARSEALHAACIELLADSLLLILRARNIRQAAIMRSGIKEGFDVAARLRSPLDPLDFGNWLVDQYAPLNGAQVVIWTLGDKDLIGSANRVMHVATDLVGQATRFPDLAPPPGDAPFTEKMKHVAQGVRKIQPDPAVEEKIRQLITQLGQARRDFASVVRARAGMDSPELILSEFEI